MTGPGQSDEIAELRRQLELVTRQRDALAQQRNDAISAAQEAAKLNSSLTAELLRSKATIRLLQGAVFGRKSERLKSSELEKLGQAYFDFTGTEARDENGEPQVPVPEAVPELPEAETESKPKPKKRRTPRRSIELDAAIERIVHRVDVPEGDRACTHCGVPMTEFGVVEHERIEFIPARIVVHVEQRQKLACKNSKCRGEAITADRVSPTSGRRVGVSLLAHLIEAKCDDAQPIHRQCDQLARIGLKLPEETAYGYWKQATSMLTPVADALFGEVMQGPAWVGLDDTGLDVLDRTRKRGKFRGHLWCAHSSRKLTAYRFTESWEAAEIEPWIGLLGPDTKVQVDDYKGYSKIIQRQDGGSGPLIAESIRLGCMMHVRRRFFQALKAGDLRAKKPVEWIKQLYKIEEIARGYRPEKRLELRDEKSLPVLDEFYDWSKEKAVVVGKTGYLAEAVRYANQQEVYVRACFADGRYEIDNGATEREIRKPAIGRKNFLFTGSVDAAHRLAAAYSLVQTCRNLQINTRDYLMDVLTKIDGGWPMRNLAQLMPHRWADTTH